MGIQSSFNTRLHAVFKVNREQEHGIGSGKSLDPALTRAFDDPIDMKEGKYTRKRRKKRTLVDSRSFFKRLWGRSIMIKTWIWDHLFLTAVILATFLFLFYTYWTRPHNLPTEEELNPDHPAEIQD